MDFLNIINESESEFRSIAEILINNHAIQTRKTLYRITELEFYWNSPNHKDNSTYNRNHVDPNTGDWFFHYSGVDIALKNESTGGYGGILLRGIVDTNDPKQKYNGPMVTAMRLFSENSAFENTMMPKIIKYDFPRVEIHNTERIGLGKNAVEHEAYKHQYRFFIAPKSL